MRKILKIIFRIILMILLFCPIVLVILVRFTDGTFSGGDKIFLGYDEAKGRFQFFEKKVFELNGIDGPYIIRDTIIRVTEDNKIIKEMVKQDSLLVVVNNKDRDSFTVSLQNENHISPSEYTMPSKLITISDIEGNFDGFSSFLYSNKVIDDTFNWVFGDGHLVLLGDFVDRGENVLPTLWLIYKLEAEAKQSGGSVHFILGNHEIMNIQGNFSSAKNKYKKIATEISKLDKSKENYKAIYSDQSFLGKWIRKKNVVEKIGDYIFVHGGLSPKILSLDLEIEEINQVTRKNIDFDLQKKPNEDSKASFLMGVEGPFWYRGYVDQHNKHYDRITSDELSAILYQYKSKHIVIGHTVVDTVSKDIGGLVIRIDVNHGQKKFSDKTKGLLIENGKEFVIDGIGNRKEL